MKQYNEKDIEEILQNNSTEIFKALEYQDESVYIPTHTGQALKIHF